MVQVVWRGNEKKHVEGEHYISRVFGHVRTGNTSPYVVSMQACNSCEANTLGEVPGILIQPSFCCPVIADSFDIFKVAVIHLNQP